MPKKQINKINCGKSQQFSCEKKTIKVIIIMRFSRNKAKPTKNSAFL